MSAFLTRSRVFRRLFTNTARGSAPTRDDCRFHLWKPILTCQSPLWTHQGTGHVSLIAMYLCSLQRYVCEALMSAALSRATTFSFFFGFVLSTGSLAWWQQKWRNNLFCSALRIFLASGCHLVGGCAFSTEKHGICMAWRWRSVGGQNLIFRVLLSALAVREVKH